MELTSVTATTPGQTHHLLPRELLCGIPGLLPFLFPESTISATLASRSRNHSAPPRDRGRPLRRTPVFNHTPRREPSPYESPVQYPTIARVPSPEPRNITDNRGISRPFTPEQYYLAVTLPTRTQQEHSIFLQRCAQLRGQRDSVEITHPISDLYQLAPHPSHFEGYLWRYRITINAFGITEEYRTIEVGNLRTGNLVKLVKSYKVHCAWSRLGYSTLFE